MTLAQEQLSERNTGLNLNYSKRLREASSSIREYLESRYLKYLNVERTGKMYGTIVDRSDDDEDGSEFTTWQLPENRRMPGIGATKVLHNAAVH